MKDIKDIQEEINEISSLMVESREEKSLSDDEFNGLCVKYGVKKTYNYGKSWYGQAKVLLLNGNNGAIYQNENGFASYHKNANEAFNRAKGFTQYRYQMTKLMGM